MINRLRNQLKIQSMLNSEELIYENGKISIETLSEIIKIEIKKIKSLKLIKYPKTNMKSIFSIIKLNAKVYDYEDIEIFLKIINKSELQKTISYYWILIYEEESIKEKNKTLSQKLMSNKLELQKIDEDKYTETLIIKIEENDTNVLKYGSLIYITEINKFLTDKKQKKERFFEDEKILFIGIKNNKGMNDSLIKVHP